MKQEIIKKYLKEKQRAKIVGQRDDKIQRKLEEAAAAAATLTPASSAKFGGQEKGSKQSMSPGVPTGPGEDLKAAGIFQELLMQVDMYRQQGGPYSGPGTQGLGAPHSGQGAQGPGEQGDLKRGLTMDQGLKDLKDYLKK